MKTRFLSLAIMLVLALAFVEVLAIPMQAAHAWSPDLTDCTSGYEYGTAGGGSETPSPPNPWVIASPMPTGVYCFDGGLTYNTQITIGESGVTIETTPGTFTAGVPSTYALIQPSTVTDNGASAPADFAPAIIYVGTGLTGVNVQYLTVDGSVAGSTVPSNVNSCSLSHGVFGCWFGISYWGASGAIENNVVENINNGGSSGGYATTPGWGDGIHVGTPSGTASVTISGNTVSNYAENGITCRSTGMTCTISGNTVYPLPAATMYEISNGIEVAFGASGSITGNTVSGNTCTGIEGSASTLWIDIEYPPTPPSNSVCGPSPYSFDSTGIYTSGSSGVTISGNTVTGNDQGIVTSSDTGAVPVTSNVISGSKYEGLEVEYETYPATISGNNVYNTLCSAWIAAQNNAQPPCGSDLVADNQAIGILTVLNTGGVAISGNTLATNDVGIYAYGDTGTVTSTSNAVTSSTYVGLVVYDESQTVSGNTFSTEPVGIEAISDGATTSATVSSDTFSSSVTAPTTEIANGGTPQITGTPVVPTPTVTNNPAGVGQSVTFTAAPTGGSGIYITYTWTGLPTGCTTANLAMITCAPSTATGSPFSVSVAVTDSNGNSVTSGALSFTVNPPPLSAGTLSSSTGSAADVNQLTTLSTTGATGGSGTYSYAWTNLPAGCSSSNSASISCTPAATTGSPFTVTLTVTDGNGNTAQATLALTVNSAGTVSVSPVTIDNGQTASLTALASGGSGTGYTYAWYLGTSCSGSVLGTSASYGTGALSATTAYCVLLTDSLGGTATTTVTVTVNAPLAVSVSAVTIDHGQTATLTAAPSGGSGSYTYAWYQGDVCSGSVLGTSASYTTGTLTVSTDYCVQVADTLGSTAKTTVTVTVNPAPSVSVSPVTIDHGQTATLTATSSGGSGTGYTYAWYLGTSCSGSVLGTSASYGTGALSATTAYCVLLTDSLGGTATTTVTVTVNPVLTVSVPTPAAIDSGQTAALTASPSGGSGTGYTYAWYQGDVCSGSVLGTSASYTTAALTFTNDYCVRVTDSLGGTATTTVKVTVNPALSVSVSPVTIDNGQTARLAAFASGGSSSYASYAWYLSACTGTSLVTGASNTYTTAALTSSTEYCVKVTDSLGGTATTPVEVTVSGTLSISLLPVTIDSGQTAKLAASASGGTGSYTYAWYQGVTCSGSVVGTSASYVTTTLTSTTSYCFKVTDSLGSSTTYTVMVTVNSAPSVSVSPVTIDNGQAAKLAAFASGGSSSYASYAWYLSACNGTPLAAGVSNTYTTVTLTSTTQYCVQVTDSLGGRATATVTVTVNPLLIVSVPKSTAIDSGQSTTLTATPSGGSGTGYTYAWYSGGSCTWAQLQAGTSASYATGALVYTTQYCVQVSDSLSGTATTAVIVTVNPVLTVFVAPATIDSGQTARLAASASGGSSSYATYAWYSGSSCTGIPRQSGASISYTTAALTSNTRYCLQVADSLGGTATATVTVTVNPLLIVSVSIPAAIDSGQSTTLTATPSGGSGTGYTYAWYSGSILAWYPGRFCIGTRLEAGASASYTAAALTSMTQYCVQVADSLGGIATTTVTVTVNPVLSTITLSSGGAAVDQTSMTGTNVTITGSTAPNGTSVAVTSQNWGTTQPPGTGSVSLNSTNFLVIQVKGISYGTAEVCITNQVVTPATVMQYWYGTQWIGAGSQTVTGATICGEVPVAALRGTPIALGTLATASGGTVAMVSCANASVTLGTASTCKATVSGSGLTGTVSWSSSSSGRFSKLTCKLSKGACLVQFTPTAAGSSVVLTANYGGTSKNSSSVGSYILIVARNVAKTTLSCTPTSTVAGSWAIIICKARVTGHSPAGTVSWSQRGTGSVSIPATTCTLTKGTCFVTMTASSSGHVTVTAAYLGDSNNQGSSRTAALTIRKAPTATTLLCTKSSFGTRTPITCTATVSGGYPLRSGTVTWSKVSGTGNVTFSSTVCNLSSGSCSVTVTATSSGSIRIKAAYSGDSNDQVSFQTASLIIKKTT